MKRWLASVWFDKKWRIGRLKVSAKMNKGDGFMGRMGGGWLWKLGMLGGSTEIVFELFVMTLRVNWRKEELK